jgi:hypothetical protein
MRVYRLLRRALFNVVAGAALLAAAAPAWAQASPDVPVDHELYDALESLDTTGLIDSRISLSRPLSRTEAARLLLQAADAPRLFEFDGTTAMARRLEWLTHEFGTEMDVLEGGSPELTQFYWKPLEAISWSYADREGPRPPDGRQGRDVVEGEQFFVRMQTHGAAGPFAFALEPELRLYPDDFGPAGDESEVRGRLLTGYGRLSLFGFDLTAGRFTTDWGPLPPRGGDRLIFGVNARPFTQVSLRTSEPVLLPWIFSYLGPLHAEAFTGVLENGRTISEALIGGLRLTIRPVPWVEGSLFRAFMFGGDDRPVNVGLMLAGNSDNVTGSQRDLSNQVGGGDVRIRVPLPWGMGVAAYGEFFGEDEAGGLPSKWSGRGGLHLAGLPPFNAVELRAEYAQTHRAAYRHGTYTSGWNYYDDPIGHHMGGGASDVSGEILIHAPVPRRWGLWQLRVWGSVEIRGRRSRPGFPGEEHRQYGAELRVQLEEGPLFAVEAWWLDIHRVNGQHGVDDEGAHVAVRIGYRF